MRERESVEVGREEHELRKKEIERDEGGMDGWR